MRFIIAFIILCWANGPVAVGWALFLCLWKIADILDDLKPKKPDTANPSLQGTGHLVDRTLQGVVGHPK